MEALEKGSIYTAVIDGYSSEGLGIARVNGAVVFVPHAVRGEEIDLRITKVMKTSCAGEIVKIHDPSPERMEPECPYAGKCGGCAYRHLTYPEELWAKRQRVQDALTRIGGLELTVEEILGAKNPEHYRNKSQYPVGADGSIGFFQARTHKVVPIRRCLIQTEAADRTAPELEIAALSEDGIVEALEKPDAHFCLGVQWHPEWLSEADPRQQALFDAFVKACH